MWKIHLLSFINTLLQQKLKLERHGKYEASIQELIDDLTDLGCL